MAYLYPMKLYVYAISAKIVSFSYLHPWKFIIIYANTSFACHVVHGSVTTTPKNPTIYKRPPKKNNNITEPTQKNK